MNNPLRELARSEYAQNIYRASKTNGIKLFENSSNLGRLQIVYLSFLSLYDSIYTDIASDMLEDAVMDMERIENDFLVDCYLTYKRKSKGKKEKRKPQTNAKGIPSISFVAPNKKRR